MKWNWRAYLALFMGFAILATAHSAAAMQGMGDASGQMVICTGNGAQIVYVDGEGAPTAPPHYCPKCHLHLLDAVLPAPDTAAPGPAGRRIGRTVERVALASAQRLRAVARGPPAAA